MVCNSFLQTFHFRILSLTFAIRHPELRPSTSASILVSSTCTGARSGLPEEISSHHRTTPMSERLSTSIMLRPAPLDDSLLFSDSPVNTITVDFTVQYDYGGEITGLPFGHLTSTATREESQTTGFEHQRLILNEGPETEPTASFYGPTSKLLPPAALDGSYQQGLENSDSSSRRYLPESYPGPLPHSELTAYKKKSEAQETGKETYLNKEVTQDASSDTGFPHGPGSSNETERRMPLDTEHDSQHFSSGYPADITSKPQTNTHVRSCFSATKTSSREQDETVINGTNLSRRLSKQGVELILGTVLGGSLAFVGIVFLHRLVLRSFHKHKKRSNLVTGSLAENESSSKRSGLRLPATAEVSHFSIGS